MARRELCEEARDMLADYQQNHRFRTRDWNGLGIIEHEVGSFGDGFGVTLLLEKGPEHKAAKQVERVLDCIGLSDLVTVTYQITGPNQLQSNPA